MKSLQFSHVQLVQRLRGADSRQSSYWAHERLRRRATSSSRMTEGKALGFGLISGNSVVVNMRLRIRAAFALGRARSNCSGALADRKQERGHALLSDSSRSVYC